MNLGGVSRRWSSSVWLVLFAALACAPNLAARAANRYGLSDVRCVVVGLRMVEMPVSQQRAAGMMLAIYYLGRLDGRAPDTEVEGLIEREAEKMTAAEFRSNAVRCGKALTLKGQEIQRIGADLSRKAQGGGAPK
jgi:hypothetical protein